jgi:hypothetical protein
MQIRSGANRHMHSANILKSLELAPMTIPTSLPLVSHLTAALDYAHRGWSVIPLHTPTDGGCSCGKPTCGHPGKHPRIEWREYQTRSSSEDEIRTWWSRWPEANIGVVTGTVSGLVVVDIDPRHRGMETLAHLEVSHGALPETVKAQTGGGGQHLFFVHPLEGVKIASKANALGSGVDLKADGGYVVVSPSRHATGHPYSWCPLSGPGLVMPAPLPTWIVDQVEAKEAFGSMPGHLDDESSATILEGRRNDTLYRLTRSLNARGLSASATEAAVKAENMARCQPPLSDDEVDDIIEKAIRQPNQSGFGAAGGTPPVSGQQAGPQTLGPRPLPSIRACDRELRDI